MMWLRVMIETNEWTGEEESRLWRDYLKVRSRLQSALFTRVISLVECLGFDKNKV